ncbi:protein toll-like isoform X2 [Anastrepha ludens]|uniref:protein toll-like isoform X2 n=1 Tax=Anastrepha ludens TaxID=28586 RepID=UPI0023B17346|nr:protein toll-like isoform X2 [Anastrepha ludens]
MPHRITNIYKNSKIAQGRPFSLLITLFALTELYVRLEATNLPVSLPQICNNEECECNVSVFECQLRDKFGLVTVEVHMTDVDGPLVIHDMKITCVQEPFDINLLLSQISEIGLRTTTKFYLKKCLTLPLLFCQPNITYSGSVEFHPYIDVRADFFRHSKQLEKLTLPVNVQYVDDPLPGQLLHNLTSLKCLELIAWCSLVQLSWPVDLFHTLYNLEELSLEIVSMRTSLQGMVSTHFRDLRSLKQLKLDSNYMKTLAADLFAALPELNRLSLKYNSLDELPQNLLRMQRKLVVLDLSNNKLKALPSGLFDNTPLLWNLALSNNRLSVPSNIIENLHSLSYLYRLDLDDNRFETIWGAGKYSNMSFFSRDNISDPQIVPHFERMAYDAADNKDRHPLNYVEIILRKNRISHFTFDWIAKSGIRCPYFVDLSQNAIRSVQAILRPPATSCMNEVHLSDNPLACDCELSWIYNTNILVDGDYWTCATPSQLSGNGLQNMQRTDLCSWSPAWCPDKCVCTQHSSMLVVDCKRARLQSLVELPRPEQLSLKETMLYLEHNLFYQLPSNATFGYANVTRLYAAHNRLNVVLASHLPPNLSLLDVRSNHLEHLSAGFLLAYLNESTTLTELYLSDNPWLCDCEAELLLYTVRAQRSRIPDVDELYCANLPNATLLNVTFTDICELPTGSFGFMAHLIAIFLVILVLLSLITLYYKYELEVKVWLHAHCFGLMCFSVDELDKDKTFDAFISYSHKEAHYVNRILVPGLECGVPAFRICTHERNWLAGAYIAEQIVESVAQSRRTIIVLSQHFVESDWGRMEFKTAHQCAVNEGRARIIIIKYGEITNMAGLDNELEAYLKMNTYLESEDPRFWQKLRYAMPHRRGEGKKAGMLEVGERVYVTGQVELNQLKGL